MKKIIGLLLIAVLIMTGCSNDKNIEKTVSSKLYSYDVAYWQKHEKKQDKIAKQIYDFWIKNDGVFGINREVTAEVTKILINEHIQEYKPAEEEKIFDVACKSVGMDCSLFKRK